MYKSISIPRTQLTGLFLKGPNPPKQGRDSNQNSRVTWDSRLISSDNQSVYVSPLFHLTSVAFGSEACALAGCGVHR